MEIDQTRIRLRKYLLFIDRVLNIIYSYIGERRGESYVENGILERVKRGVDALRPVHRYRATNNRPN